MHKMQLHSVYRINIPISLVNKYLLNNWTQESQSGLTTKKKSQNGLSSYLAALILQQPNTAKMVSTHELRSKHGLSTKRIYPLTEYRVFYTLTIVF